MANGCEKNSKKIVANKPQGGGRFLQMLLAALK
jgi:hypothetical protein